MTKTSQSETFTLFRILGISAVALAAMLALNANLNFGAVSPDIKTQVIATLESSATL